LALLARTANVSLAAKAVGISRRRAYQLRARDAAFREAWNNAREEGLDCLEAEAWRRAVHGTRRAKAVYYQGRKVGADVDQEYSDTLLIFLLKAARPEKYRDRHDHRHAGTLRHDQRDVLTTIDGYAGAGAKLAARVEVASEPA
jgi:hypothetical protein